ncbi:MAG TPA: PEP-utilizing enzyme [Solirubrobacteraceae bacterium]|nr:PEP-utilizing enzyme [Solirubrobacteraceae bacterium]
MQQTQTLAPGAPIPVPPEFPVQWSRPDDPQQFWEHDRMHFPEALTPMDGAVIVRLGAGFTFGARAYELPLDEVRMTVINGWQYQAIVPKLLPPEEMEELGRRAEANLMGAIGRLGSLWEDDLLPEIREHLAWWAAFDLAGSSEADLAAHLRETWRRLGRLWELHFLTVLPSYIAVSEFDEMCRALFEGSALLDSMRMLGGFDSLTVRGDQGLWRLSRKALTAPEVQDVLERRAAHEVPAALEETGPGRDFLDALGKHLDEFGQRGHGVNLSSPSWIEDPTPAIKVIKDLMGRPDGEAPAIATREKADEREAAIAAARETLQGYPAPVREQFEGMLAAAQVGAVITEDHAYYIDFCGGYRVRCVLMECGRRLALADALSRPDDVFFLEPVELEEAMASPGMADMRELVALRRTELEQQRAMDVPRHLGTLPPGPPPDSPIGRFIGKFFGVPPAPPQAPGELRGAPGSAGVVRGRARVIRSLAEAERLASGEVLVTETTSPPWTPLFGVAAAIVTDTGGALSHCAVVAREYGIPAVVGTDVATSAIPDGAEIEVDGTAGIVRLV